MGNASNNKNKIKEFVQKVEEKTNNALDDSLMDEDAKAENFDVNYTDIVKNSAKARISKLPWLISIFLILIIAIMLCFMFFKSNPKTLFTQSIDGMFSYLMDNIDENVYDVIDGNVSLDYDIKSEDEVLNNLGGISWNIDYVKDNSSSQVYANIKADNGSSVVPIILYGDGSNTYFSLKSISEKYIKMNSNPLSYFINGSDLKVILKGINQAVDKAVVNEKIYGSKDSVRVNNDNLKAYKMRLIIDDTNRDRVCEAFINTLKANDELISVISAMRNVSSEDVKRAINNYLPKIKDELKKYDKLEVSLYIDNQTKDFIKLDMNSEAIDINLTNIGENKYTYSISNKEEGLLKTGDFSFSVNDSKTKYTVLFTYKETLNNKVMTEGNVNLKFTSKKAGSFLESEDTNKIINDEMSELEKFDVYAKIFTDPFFSRILPLVQKMV